MKLWKKIHARHAQHFPSSELINKKEKDSNSSCIWSTVAFSQILVIIIWQKYSCFNLLISNVRFQAINMLLLKIINGYHKLFGETGKLSWFNWHMFTDIWICIISHDYNMKNKKECWDESRFLQLWIRIIHSSEY